MNAEVGTQFQLSEFSIWAHEIKKGAFPLVEIYVALRTVTIEIGSARYEFFFRFWG